MKPARNIAGLSVLAMFALLSLDAAAQAFPARPLRMVVPYPPGGGTDVISRTLAQKMSDDLKQPVLTENRGGGGQIIGSEIVARALPDGHTLLLASVTHSINPSLVPQLPYDTVRDFTPISFVGSSPLVLVVNPDVAAKSVRELIALAKVRPGKLNYASAGNGSGGHLAFEVLKGMAGLDMVHVPYTGAKAITDLVAGEVQAMITSPTAVASLARAGKLRMLATSGKTRPATLPDVPTMAESGVPGYEATLWYAILGPRAVPHDVVMRLNTSLRGALAAPDLREKFEGNGVEAQATSPEELATYINSEIAKWKSVIEKANIRM